MLNITDETIWKYILGETSQDEARAIEQIASGDFDVAKKLADARATNHLLREFLPKPAADKPAADDDALAALIAAEIEADEKSDGSVSPPKNTLMVFLPWAAVAACLMILGVNHWMARSSELTWSAPTIAVATYRGDGVESIPGEAGLRRAALDLQKLVTSTYRSTKSSSTASSSTASSATWVLDTNISVLFDGAVVLTVTAVSSTDAARTVMWPSTHRSFEELLKALPLLAAELAQHLADETAFSPR